MNFRKLFADFINIIQLILDITYFKLRLHLKTNMN